MLAFVNGMGGTPLLELYIVYAEVAKIAAEHGLTIDRNLVGNYITSLEMQGCSITLLKLDDELIHYWDAPVNTPGVALGGVVPIDRDTRSTWMSLFAEEMTEHRQELVRLDTAIGDGDHGTNMNRGMQKAVQKLRGVDPLRRERAQDCRDDADLTVGGAAGPLYGTLFLQMGSALAGKDKVEWLTTRPLGARASTGVQARGKADSATRRWSTPSRRRSMRSTRRPASTRACRPPQREQGMLATTPLVARKGRASYLGERAGHQDPGATSSYYLMTTAAETLAH